ncbi:glycoside hydrolase family 16 protein [Myriangium duriaei CBS 260.36]|uniref:chitinase n=1 Tax=Myriangium duriaei CBS 260.36 TaxID=1168546 RepID=A0A9P4IYD6_9PEZI|nr:glycoside hydrolase family 16 protein [Myriangium duriaei CBS 260.36]
MLSVFRSALLALALTSSVLAQTFTECNPLERDDCPVNTALGTTASFNWTTSGADSSVWNTTNGQINFATDGAEFSIARKGQSPTIQSIFYIFFGRVSIIMKAAPGQGIVSSVVLESADLDEIDWEWIGGNTTHVQTNFFGKGDNTTYDRAIWYPVDNTLAEHNYTTVWTQPSLQWYIDGQMVRELLWDDPKAMSHNKSGAPTPVPGDRYPQTPMTVKIGNWAGGDPSENAEGVVEWAGGAVNYDKGPYVQVVSAVEVEDFTKGSTYTYGDKTGSWESIKVATGNSTIANTLAKPHGVKMRWSNLPQGARIGIIGGAIGVGAICLILFTFCCIKNRRAGRKERAIADAEWERNLTELQRYKQMMVAEEEIHPRAGYI